eukprot:489708-Pyramimonas_sp.AAC.1
MQFEFVRPVVGVAAVCVHWAEKTPVHLLRGVEHILGIVLEIATAEELEPDEGFENLDVRSDH